MKNLFKLMVLVFICFTSCSKEVQTDEGNTLSKARTYLEAAAILSDYNLEPDAYVNVAISLPMNTNISRGHVDMQALFNTPNGTTVSGSVEVNPFGELPVDGPNLDVYRLNDAFSEDIISDKESIYSIKYVSDNSIYSDFDIDVPMDFGFMVNNNLQYLDGVNYIDKSNTVNLTWEPLSLSSSSVYVGFCASGRDCFYEEVPDNGRYNFDKKLYSDMSSGTYVNLVIARGYQRCIENSSKELCITNFTIANPGVVKIQ